MNDPGQATRPQGPLTLERSLALIFALLGILATALLTLHWFLVLEPTVRAEVQSQSRLLAQAQAQGIEQRLGSGHPERLRDDLTTALDGLLLLKDQSLGLPFIRRITLELDYEQVEAPVGSLDLDRGAASCPECLVFPVPLYRPADRQLIGVATFYSSPVALQTLIDGFRVKLLLGGGFLLCLIGATWLWTGRLLKRVTQSEANLRVLFEAAPFPMVLHADGAAGLGRANQAAVDYLNLREDDSGHLTSPAWRALLDRGLPGDGESHRERLVQTQEDSERWALVSAIPLQTSDGRSELVSLVDVSQLKAYQNELHLASITDALTGLYNRRYLFLRLSEEIERAARGPYRFSIALLDLDHFKQVNDSFGHGVGDDVLIRSASALRGAIRATDLAGRYGGEEFLVVLPDTGAAEAMKIVERMRSAIKALSWPQLGLRLTLSGGVCAYDGRDDIDSLLERADKRLYTAKAAGRDRIIGEDPTR